MDYIREISEMYHGNISLQPPCQTEITSDVPAEITSMTASFMRLMSMNRGLCADTPMEAVKHNGRNEPQNKRCFAENQLY